jgi:hypothetical protein
MSGWELPRGSLMPTQGIPVHRDAVILPGAPLRLAISPALQLQRALTEFKSPLMKIVCLHGVARVNRLLRRGFSECLSKSSQSSGCSGSRSDLNSMPDSVGSRRAY